MDVKIKYKNAHTLTFSAPDRRVVAIVARPLGRGIKVESAQASGDAPSGPQLGMLASRG